MGGSLWGLGVGFKCLQIRLPLLLVCLELLYLFYPVKTNLSRCLWQGTLLPRSVPWARGGYKDEQIRPLQWFCCLPPACSELSIKGSAASM